MAAKWLMGEMEGEEVLERVNVVDMLLWFRDVDLEED